MKAGDRVRVAVAGHDVLGTVALAFESGRPLLLELDEPIKLDTQTMPAAGALHDMGGMFITSSLPIMRARDGSGFIDGFIGSAISIRPAEARVAPSEGLMHATIELSGAISDASILRSPNSPDDDAEDETDNDAEGSP